MSGIEPAVSLAEVRGRQEQTRRLLQQEGYIGALVVGRGFFDRCGSLAWLTNHFPPFIGGPFADENGGVGHGFLILPAEGEPALCGDFHRQELVAVSDIRQGPAPVKYMLEALADRGLTGGRIALVGADLVPYLVIKLINERYPDLHLDPRDDLVEKQRMYKSPREIELLRHAARVCDLGLEAAVAAIRPGNRDWDVCAAGTGKALAAGADFVRYLRVHSGPWSAFGVRWPQALDRILEDGDMVTVDLIGAVNGYQFDVLRTAVVGTATEQQRHLVRTVNAILDAQVAACRHGVAVADLAAIAVRMAEEAGFGKFLTRSMGHGIGIETMEWPYLVPGSSARIEAGMVLCIEPGIYVPDVGGCRIEEEVVVLPDGPPEVISRYPRHLV